MKAINKNILLIAYIFPPYPGIGGRRWAKFAKYLSRNGYTIHVICADNPFSERSLWLNDIMSDPNIILYKLNSYYPPVLLKTFDFSFVDKIKYHFWLKVLPLFVKGTIYDPAVFWRKPLLKRSEEIIESYKIKNVIVTGAPFRNLYYGSFLKMKYPDINLIGDFRDPWTEGKSYGFEGLSPKNKEYELQMEKQVCESYDLITAPSLRILEYLRSAHNITEDKFLLLEHAFDNDEFIEAFAKPRIVTNKLQIVFSGTVYEGAEIYFENFFNSLENIRTAYPEFADRIILKFYSGQVNVIEQLVPERLLNSVAFFPPLNPSELFSEIAISDYVLIVFVDKYKNYLSTKFYELINLNKFIIYIGPAGDVSDFIVRNKLGVAITNVQDMNVKLNDVLTNKKQSESFPGIQNFSYNNVTEQLIEKLL